jgi:phosphoribosylanthranilate isomerase
LPAHVIGLRKMLPNTLLIRSIPVTEITSVSIAKSYDGAVDFLLLDSHRAGDRQIGALGVTHDWSISRNIVESARTPVILAGGLGSDNVVEAIRAVPSGNALRGAKPGDLAVSTTRVFAAPTKLSNKSFSFCF